MSTSRKVEPPPARRRGWILAGVDFSKPARQALIEARHLARERDAGLMVLHVIDSQGLEETARLAEIPESRLRERRLAAADYNLFALPADRVMFDLRSRGRPRHHGRSRRRFGRSPGGRRRRSPECACD